MEKTPRLIGRVKAAELLDMTPNALSCHVARRNWDAVPEPIKVGGCFKWSVEQIAEWIDKRFEKRATASKNKKIEATRNRVGRPNKRRSASC